MSRKLTAIALPMPGKPSCHCRRVRSNPERFTLVATTHDEHWDTSPQGGTGQLGALGEDVQFGPCQRRV